MLVNILNQFNWIECANEETLNENRTYYVCDSPDTKLMMTTDTVTGKQRPLADSVAALVPGLIKHAGTPLELSAKSYVLKTGSIVATDDGAGDYKFLKLKNNLTVKQVNGTTYIPSDGEELVFITTVDQKEDDLKVTKVNDATEVTLPKDTKVSFCYNYDKFNPMFKLTDDMITCESVQSKNEFMFLTKSEDSQVTDAAFTELHQFVDLAKLDLIKTNYDLIMLSKTRLLENVNKGKFTKQEMQLGTSCGVLLTVVPKVKGKRANIINGKELYDAVCEKMKNVNVSMEALLENTSEMTKEQAEEMLRHYQLYEYITGIQKVFKAFDTNNELELLREKLIILFGYIADCNKTLLPTVDCSKLEYGECAKNVISRFIDNFKHLVKTEIGKEGRTVYKIKFTDGLKISFVEYAVLLYRTLKARELRGIPATPEMTEYYALFSQVMDRFSKKFKSQETDKAAEILAKVTEISNKFDQLLTEKYLLRDSLTALDSELQAQITENEKLEDYDGPVIKAIHETRNKKCNILKNLKELLASATLVADFETDVTAKAGEIDAAKSDKAKLEELQKTFEKMLAFFNENKDLFGDDTKQGEIETGLQGHIDAIKTQIAEYDKSAAITALVTEAQTKTDETTAALVDTVKTKEELESLQTEGQTVFAKIATYADDELEKYPDLKAAKEKLEEELQKLATKIQDLTTKEAVDTLVVEAQTKTDEIKAVLVDTSKKTKDELDDLEKSAEAVFDKFATYGEADLTKYPDLKAAKENLTGELKNLRKVTDPSGKKAIDKLKVEAKAKTAEIKSALADKTKTVDDLEKVQKDSKVTLQMFEQFTEEIKTEKDLQTAKDELTKEMDSLDKQIAAMKKTPEDPKKAKTLEDPKEKESKEKEGLSTGAIIGIVIGVIAAIAVVGVVAWLIYTQNATKKEIEEL